MSSKCVQNLPDNRRTTNGATVKRIARLSQEVAGNVNNVERVSSAPTRCPSRRHPRTQRDRRFRVRANVSFRYPDVSKP